MIALDASVLIAHLAATDAHHQRATQLLLERFADALVVHPMTMAEVLVGGVRVGRGKQMQDALIDAGVTLAPADSGEPLRLAELRCTTRLKLPDCCVLDVALQHRATLATFDERLAAVARSRGLLVTG